METTDGAGVRFIQAFARNNSESNISELVGQFADSFLFAGPTANQWVRACDFALALPRRKQIFEQLGHRSTELTDVQEQWLGERYVLVRSRWRFTFERSGQAVESLENESSFLVDAGAGPFRILVYVAHKDILEILQGRAATSSNA